MVTLAYPSNLRLVPYLWNKYSQATSFLQFQQNSIITQKPVKYNFDDLKEFTMHITELLEKGYIQESNSKHTSPVNKKEEKVEWLLIIEI